MRFLIGVSLAALMMGSSVAWAEQESEYDEQIAEGHRLFAGSDHDGAMRAYRRALRDQESDPLAVYLIACVQRAMNDLDEALESFQEAARLAGESNAELKSKALMNIAFTHEARRDFEAAREAWRAYINFAASHGSVRTYPQNGTQRNEAITAWEELDAAYAPVRERIQAREAENASSSD